MIPYQSKARKLSGTSYSEVIKQARTIFREIERRTKRKPYIRSAYFKKDKVFFDFFWSHLLEKSLKDRVRRLKYLPCAIDLIKNSKIASSSKPHPDRKGEILHRFLGQTRDREVFFVQIKEDRKTGRKYLMSVFPPE